MDKLNEKFLDAWKARIRNYNDRAALNRFINIAVELAEYMLKQEEGAKEEVKEEPKPVIEEVKAEEVKVEEEPTLKPQNAFVAQQKRNYDFRG